MLPTGNALVLPSSLKLLKGSLLHFLRIFQWEGPVRKALQIFQQILQIGLVLVACELALLRDLVKLVEEIEEAKVRDSLGARQVVELGMQAVEVKVAPQSFFTGKHAVQEVAFAFDLGAVQFNKGFFCCCWRLDIRIPAVKIFHAAQAVVKFGHFASAACCSAVDLLFLLLLLLSLPPKSRNLCLPWSVLLIRVHKLGGTVGEAVHQM